MLAFVAENINRIHGVDADIDTYVVEWIKAFLWILCYHLIWLWTKNCGIWKSCDWKFQMKKHWSNIGLLLENSFFSDFKYSVWALMNISYIWGHSKVLASPLKLYIWWELIITSLQHKKEFENEHKNYRNDRVIKLLLVKLKIHYFVIACTWKMMRYKNRQKPWNIYTSNRNQIIWQHSQNTSYNISIQTT